MALEKFFGNVLRSSARLAVTPLKLSALPGGSKSPYELAYGGDDALPPPLALGKEEEHRLWRKVDWHIMPCITVLYLCSFVDRSNIGACGSTVFEALD